MAVGARIILRKGTKANLDTVMGGGSPLLNGEIGFTTDTNEVYISDGSTIHLVGKVIVDVFSNRPAAGVSGRIFYASDTGALYIDNGSTWSSDISSGVTDLDGVSDGTTYGRVRQTELDDGYVTQIWTSASGTVVTASGIDSHINDVTIHRSINDSGTSSTDLWSASKIQSELDAATSNFDTVGDVLDKQVDATLDPGVSPSAGDSYILTDISNLHANFGTISGVGDNDIVTYDSGFYVSYDASVEDGALAWVTASGYYESFNGLSWNYFGGLSGITAGDGVYKTNDTLHVGAGDGIDVSADSVAVDVTDIIGSGLSEDGSNNIRVGAQGNGIAGGDGSLLSVQADTSGISGVAPVVVTVSGVGISVDDYSIVHTAGQIKIDIVDGGTFL